MLRLLLLVVYAMRETMAIDNGLARAPPLGWSTWETCAGPDCAHDVCNEQEVDAAADALVSSGLHALGWKHVILDDCWAGRARNNITGELTWDTSRFPLGIPALADRMHARGLLLGVYTSAGDETCHGALPGSRGHYDLDARTFAAWQVDYIKFDWYEPLRSHVQSPGRHLRKHVLCSEVLTLSGFLIRLGRCGDIKTQVWEIKKAHVAFAAAVNASGRHMAIETVAGYFGLLHEVGTVANAFRFCVDHKDSWASTKEQIMCRLALTGLSGVPGAWPFMDLLTTGGKGCVNGTHCPGQTPDEYRTEFAVWAITQSPMVVATDVRHMTAVMTQTMLNAELIRMHQSTATPSGGELSHWECSEFLKCVIYGRRLSTNGSDWLLGLVNLGNHDHKITAKWKLLGWPSSKLARVRDVFAQSTWPNSTSDEVVSRVPSHGTVLLRVTAVAWESGS